MNTKEQNKRIKRDKHIISMRDQGLTFKEIGHYLGSTRQNAHELYKAAVNKEQQYNDGQEL